MNFKVGAADRRCAARPHAALAGARRRSPGRAARRPANDREFPLCARRSPGRKRKSLVLEPRRIAARAHRAHGGDAGREGGGNGGYRVRFVSSVARAPSNRGGAERSCSRRRRSMIPPSNAYAAGRFRTIPRALRSTADPASALARDSMLPARRSQSAGSFSSTIDGARIAHLLGDAPVIAIEPRIPGENTLRSAATRTPIESRIA